MLNLNQPPPPPRIYHYRSKSHQRVTCTKFPCSTPPKQYLSVSGSKESLGVTFDSDNSFDNHVAKVCQACYYHLHDLQRIRKFLSVETAILLANAKV